MTTWIPRWPLTLAALGLCGGCSGTTAASRLPLTPCHLDGVAQGVLCGTYDVPEDRSTRDGRALTLHVSVLPALRRDAQPDPLVILAGGPGQGARSYAALAQGAFHRVRRTRDIVLVDLRGTGDSHALECSTGEDDLSAVGGDPTASLNPGNCLEGLDADPRFYTTQHSMADLDEVLAALGYDQVNLWGGSFGTRAALIYAREFPGRVRAVVLDGAAPFELRFPLWVAADAQRALDLLIQDCESNEACRRRFPQLRRDVELLFRKLEAQPAQVALSHPRTGGAGSVLIDRAALASALRAFLYVPAHARLVPAVMTEATQGRFEPLVALLLEGLAWSVDTMALGVTLSVICSEDVPRFSGYDVEPAVSDTFVGQSAVDGWLRLCRKWPAGMPPPRVDDVIPSAAPALILSGVLDPVTPPRWGETMARHFPASVHVAVPGAAHNASFTGCVPDLIDAFIRTPDPHGLDGSCVETTRRPPYVIGFSGNAP